MNFENSTVVQAAVTEEVVKVVMAAKNVNEKGALFLLGFDTNSSIEKRRQAIRNPKRPYELYEGNVFSGVARNQVKFKTNEYGNVEVEMKRGRIQYIPNVGHPMKDVYLNTEVVNMDYIPKMDEANLILPTDEQICNVLDFGNEWVEK